MKLELKAGDKVEIKIRGYLRVSYYQGTVTRVKNYKAYIKLKNGDKLKFTDSGEYIPKKFEKWMEFKPEIIKVVRNGQEVWSACNDEK